MRSRFLLIPAAIVAASAAHAENIMSVEQAQGLIFPGATMTPADFTMNEAQVDQLIKVSGATVFRSKVRVWRASTGGWFFIDQVPGRDDRVTYALGVDDKGAVRGVEILVCLPAYGAIMSAEWRGQLQGRQHGQARSGQDEALIVSGQTLTTAHVTDGINRLLATHALFLRPQAK